MLILITPEQISANWDFLKACIVDAGPMEIAGKEDRTNEVLNNLLIGDLQCWVEAKVIDKSFSINGIAITQILTNHIAGVRSLLIYSLFGFNQMINLDDWHRSILTLAQFARKNECQNIMAYTSNKNLIRMTERFHGDVSQRVCIIPLN